MGQDAGVEVLGFGPEGATAVDRFDSRGVQSVHLGFGEGDAHVYVLRFEADGEIGRHQAGFGQLFLVVEGRGWAEGDDGARVPLETGQAAWFRRGEMHAKGSETGMVAVMVQVTDLEPMEDEPEA